MKGEGGAEGRGGGGGGREGGVPRGQGAAGQRCQIRPLRKRQRCQIRPLRKRQWRQIDPLKKETMASDYSFKERHRRQIGSQKANGVRIVL